MSTSGDISDFNLTKDTPYLPSRASYVVLIMSILEEKELCSKF